MATQSRWTITPPTQERAESRWTITRPQQEADQEAVQERPGFFEGAPTDSSPEELARHQALRAQQGQARTALEGEREAQFVGLVDDPRAPRGGIPNMDILGNGLQGAGWSDEYQGALARLSNVWTPEGERLDPALVAQRERERVSQVREDRPVSTFLAEMGSGAVLTSPLGGSGALRSMSAARPMASAAVGGGAGGAIAGAGEANGGIRDRLMGAASAVPLGATLGPLAVKAGRGVSSVAEAGSRTARAAFDAARGRPVRDNGRMFDEVARRSGFSVDDARRLPDVADDNAFLGERMGRPGASAITAAGNRPDAASEVVADAVAQRRAGRTQRILEEVQRNTGAQRGVSAVADTRAARQEASPFFNRAREQKLELTGDLRETLEQMRTRGVPLTSADRATPRGETPLSALLEGEEGGSVRLGPLHDLVKDAEDEASNLFRNGRSNAGGEMARLHRDLRSRLREASPDFAEGSRRWRSAALDEEALTLGRRALRNGPDTEQAISDFMGREDMSASERGQFLTGVLDAIEGRVESVSSDGGNQAGRLASGTIRRRLAQVFGNDEADALVDVLNRESRQASLERAASPYEGSRTAPLTESLRELEGVEVGQGRAFAADVAKNARGALLDAPRDAFSRAIRGNNEDGVANLSRALTGSADQQNPAVAEFIARMEKQQRMREIVDQAMQPVAAVYGAQSSRSR